MIRSSRLPGWGRASWCHIDFYFLVLSKINLQQKSNHLLAENMYKFVLFLLTLVVGISSADECLGLVHLQVQNRLSAVVRAVSDYYTDRSNATDGLDEIFRYIDEPKFEGAIFLFPNGTIRRSFPNATLFRGQFPILRRAFVFFEDDMMLPSISCEGHGLLPTTVNTVGFIQIWLTQNPYFLIPTCFPFFPAIPPGCPPPSLITGSLQHVLLKTKWTKTSFTGDYMLVRLEDILQKETPWAEGVLSPPYIP